MSSCDLYYTCCIVSLQEQQRAKGVAFWICSWISLLLSSFTVVLSMERAHHCHHQHHQLHHIQNSISEKVSFGKVFSLSEESFSLSQKSLSFGIGFAKCFKSTPVLWHMKNKTEWKTTQYKEKGNLREGMFSNNQAFPSWSRSIFNHSILLRLNKLFKLPFSLNVQSYGE